MYVVGRKAMGSRRGDASALGLSTCGQRRVSGTCCPPSVMPSPCYAKDADISAMRVIVNNLARQGCG